MSDVNRNIRGCVLVICNSFAGTPSARGIPTNYDISVMKRLWGNKLRCHSFPRAVAENADFIVHKDISAQGMIDLLKNFANYETTTDYSYIAVVISTHGGLIAESWVRKWDPETSPSQSLLVSPETIYDDLRIYRDQIRDYDNEKKVEVLLGNDFRPVKEHEIRRLFYNDMSVWPNVPKFFILNYCRGDAIDGGIPLPPPATSLDAMNCGNQQVSSSLIIPPPNVTAQSFMPTISDILTVYATHHGYAAFQGDPDFGSWLISTICQVFEEHADTMHVVDMLTIVNREMKKKGGIGKAMSTYESSLEQKLYLCDEARQRGEGADNNGPQR